MNHKQLKEFVEQIIALGANVQGSGISSAGFAGASSSRQHALDDLKKKSLEFVQEHQKSTPDKEKIKELSKEIEGNLLGLNSLQVIDDNLLDKLLDDLNKIT
jgi:hypothetical protein